jgi:hypothetical protein
MKARLSNRFHGRVHCVPKDATAWSVRAATWWMVIAKVLLAARRMNGPLKDADPRPAVKLTSNAQTVSCLPCGGADPRSTTQAGFHGCF